MSKGIMHAPAGLSPEPPEVFYPDSDGEPMSDNTEQWEWMVLIKNGLEWLFADRPDVFVAGDLLWYPIKGDNKTRCAPDALVAFGRPKGRRGSYKQWEEGGVAPQVVFEVLSPGNTPAEMQRKFDSYNRFGVEEYYIYDPDGPNLEGWLRGPGGLAPIDGMAGWVSPRLGISFRIGSDGLELFDPHGQPFISFVQLARERDAERQRAEQERQQADGARQRAEQERQRAEQQQQRAEQEQQRAEQERQRAEQQQQRAEQERQRAEQEQQRAERLAAQLRALGVEPQE
jgi:Uma2 family endonuclease